MYYLLMEKFNNYLNRFMKKFDTVQEYKDYCTANSYNFVHYTTKSVNFNKRDNITSSHVFNDNLKPSYLLWIDEKTGNIVSRWFVIHYTHTSGNQFKAELKRDSLADNYSEVLESPAFIQKGFVGNSDPAVYNRENILFNQIKTSETLLKDDSHTAWIVGYVAEDHTALTNKTFTLSSKADIVISGDFEDWEYASLCDGTTQYTVRGDSAQDKIRFILRYDVIGELPSEFPYEFMFNKFGGTNYLNRTPLDYWKSSKTAINSYRASNWLSGIDWDTCISKILDDHPSWTTQTIYSYLKGLEGKTIQFDDGVYIINFGLDIESLQSDWQYYNSGNLYTYLYTQVSSGLSSYGGTISQTNRYPVAYRLMVRSFSMTATKQTNVDGTYTYSIPATTKVLSDAPYKMFCIPYYTGDKYFTFSLDGNTFKTIYPDLMMTWAMSIIKELGVNLYDIQILPYCPISKWRGLISNTRDGIWSIDKAENVDYTTLKDNSNNIVGYCSWCDVSSKQQKLKYPILIDNYKESNELDMYRVCSPNYASVFEFSPAMNGGVEAFIVRYTYKPYNPFINVAPVFRNLYGDDFKDNRGLILSGDFSLPIINDQWKNFQIQNKNYLLAFDRQIENMDYNYNWERKNAVANSIVGTIQGGTSGAMAGASVGGPWGALAGAVIGTTASGVGGLLDLERQQGQFKESKSYAYDSFGYQLGNIKALPNTLNKVSSIVANSKLFPFVEYYTCTEQEKEAFRNKIKYNGMSIGRIGYIKDFLNPEDLTFVKAQLIRNTTIACTSDELLDIYTELEKGVYI